MQTPLCDLVGIEAPIVLAPMGAAVTPELAAAASNAGALGMLPLTWTAPFRPSRSSRGWSTLSPRFRSSPPAGSRTAPTASMGGDIEPLPHWAGQGVGLVTREESAADIVASLVTEAEAVVGSLSSLRSSS